MRKTTPRFILACSLTVLLLSVVVFAPLLAPYDPQAQIFGSLTPPDARHWLGTDRLGRDLLSRLLLGLQTSVLATLLLVSLVAVIGTTVGMLAGFLGGFVDRCLMRVTDLFLALPGLVFALAVAALLGGGLLTAVLALTLVSWPKYARLARSLTRSTKQTDYVSAARLAGSSTWRITYRHVLPNIIGPILVTACLDIGTLMMELAGLSFLGLGVQPPTAELGQMMSAGRSLFQTYPWVVLSPGVLIFLTVVIFNLMADTLRDRAERRIPLTHSGKS